MAAWEGSGTGVGATPERRTSCSNSWWAERQCRWAYPVDGICTERHGQYGTATGVHGKQGTAAGVLKRSGQLVRASFRSGRRTIRSGSEQRPAPLLSKLRPSCRRRSQLLSVRHPLFWVSPCGALVFRSSRPPLAPVLREHAVTLHASFVASHVLYSLRQTLSHRKPHFKWGAFHPRTFEI